MIDVTCAPFRDLLSERLDGELDPSDEIRLDAHLDSCLACTAFEDQAVALRREMRMHAASELGSIRAPVLGADRAPSRLHELLRWALFVIGATLVVINVGALFDLGGADRHLLRHDGVFGTALGAGMLSVAWKPHRAIGLVPITSVIAALMIVVAVVDIASGDATMLGEAGHALELIGLVCLWVISGGPERARRRGATVLGRLQRPSVPPWPTV